MHILRLHINFDQVGDEAFTLGIYLAKKGAHKSKKTKPNHRGYQPQWGYWVEPNIFNPPCGNLGLIHVRYL